MERKLSPLLASYSVASGALIFDTETRPLEHGLRNENYLLSLSRGTGKEMAKLTFTLAALPNNPELASLIDQEILLSVLESYKLGLDRLPIEYKTRALAHYTSAIIEAICPTDGTLEINPEINLTTLQRVISIVQEDAKI